MIRKLLLSVGVILLLVACGRVQNERFTGAETLPEGVSLDVVLSSDSNFSTSQPIEALITLGQEGQPVSGARLEIEGNMTHAGMEPIFATASETAPGEYRVPLQWTMGGEWILTVRGTLPDGTTVEKQMEAIEVSS